MKTRVSKVLAALLCVALLASVVPFSAFATWNNVTYSGTSFGTNGYYTVISQNDYVLVPGAATETEMVLNNAAGNRRQVLHIVEVDPSNPDISIVPGYYGIDKDLTDVNNQQAAKLTDMTAYYEDVLGYNVVAGMNTDLYYEANAPRILVYNGQYLGSGRTTQSYLGVYKDANDQIYCEVKKYVKATFDAELASGNLIHAVSVSFAMTVNNGELVTKTEERTSSAAARSMVGVKEDGTLVIVMNDGRSANNSVGFCTYELGESMLALGCKWAANCDGGGSSTFVSKRAGETEATMRSVPCDGAERPTIHGIFIVSNVGPTGVLNNVNILSDYSYFAPGSTYSFDAEAIDTHGYAMDMPTEVTWTLSDSSFGTMRGNTFISSGKTGDVDVQVLLGHVGFEGEGGDFGAGSVDVIGTKTIHIANPTSFTLTSSNATIPYSTPEKVRTITLPIVAKNGEADVYTDSASVAIRLSNAAAGTLNGNVFTATSDTSISGVTITVTYLPTGQSLAYTVTYGKGSEVLWDFEDGDISAWTGTDDTEAFLKANGVSTNKLTAQGDTTALKTLHNGGQISWSNKTTTFLATRENGGQVKTGNNALGVTFNMKNVEFNSWVYAIIYNIQGNTVLRDVEHGMNATKFGCWVYVPEGFYTAKNNGALSLQLQSLKGTSSTATLSGNQLNLTYNGKNLNALTEANIPENRWIYVSADLTGANFVKLSDPLVDIYRAPSIMRMYVKPSEAQELTYYFDDFTLDYSSAVDDRNPPVISNPTFCTADENIAFNDQTLTTNVVSFNATVADYAASNAEGLDYATAAIYVDGIAQPGVTASGSTMGVENVVFSNGTHSIKFEIADKLGNYTTLTKNLTINAAAAASSVTISGHNDLGNLPEVGSVYYADLVAEDIQAIDSISTTLYLQTANTWELDHMIVADGFTASYTATEAIPNRVTVTVTKTGPVSLTGEQTLVSLPIRIWSFDESTMVGGDSAGLASYMTAAQRYASSYGEPVLKIEVDVEKGEIAYANRTAGNFGGRIDVATKVDGTKQNVWHAHDAQLTVLNKAATCAEDGYSNRTYCESCGSVIDWGTTIPAFGHDYELVDGTFVCATCGEILAASGLTEVNGVLYYLHNGSPVAGWQSVGASDYCFAKSSDKTVIVGQDYTINGVTYSFDENGLLVSGVWIETADGMKYSFGPGSYKRTWKNIDGKNYYFGTDGIMYTGVRFIKANPATDPVWFNFGPNGDAADPSEPYTVSGIYEINGDLYYNNGGVSQFGVVAVDGDYYYFNVGTGFERVGYATKSAAVTVTEARANGLVAPGKYYFGADGKLIGGTVIIDDVVYVNGAALPAYYGLVNVDGNFYYVDDGAKIIKNKSKYLTTTNDLTLSNGSLIPHSTFEFDADGKMILKNGIIDGKYYINGVAVPAYYGLVEWEGNFYYINDGGRIITNKTKYIQTTNGLTFADGTPIPRQSFDFDADGKMILKNGVVDGKVYVNGVALPAYYGLVNVDGDFYYVNDGGRIVVSQNKYLTKTNDLTFADGTAIPHKYFDFDADGKMVLKHGIIDGKYYINGVAVPSYYGLVEWDGNFYYINDNASIVRSKSKYLTTTNGLTFADGTPIPHATYEFDADGKMLIPLPC